MSLTNIFFCIWLPDKRLERCEYAVEGARWKCCNPTGYRRVSNPFLSAVKVLHFICDLFYL